MINSLLIKKQVKQNKPLNQKEKAQTVESKAYDNLQKLAEEKSKERGDNCFCGCGLAADGDNDEQEQQTTNDNAIPENETSYFLPVLIVVAAGLSLYLGYIKFNKNK